MRYDVVFFDLDGTLVDTLPDIRIALNHALAAHGRGALELDTVRTLVGEGARALVERALGLAAGEQAAAEVEAVLAAFRAYYTAHPVAASRPYPGIADVLAAVEHGGATSIVFTNKPGDVARAVLDILGLAPRFAAVIGEGDGFPRKPDPTAARVWLDKLRVLPARAAIVGDGVPDLLAARALAARAFACLWGYTPRDHLLALSPDFVAERPADVIALL